MNAYFGNAALPAATGVDPLIIPSEAKERLKLLYIAKHARSDGRPDSADGTHAVYHAEMREVLLGLGLQLEIADSYAALFDPPAVDFVFPLLNRGGFLNSEMMLPLLCTRANLPFLGASPILRGLADDKHLTKMAARSRGLPTAEWAIYRRFNPIDADLCPRAERWVVKPNASSASWGVSSAGSWAEVREAVEGLHAQGHDALVEPFVTGHDLEISVITIGGQPFILPTMIVEQHDPAELRSYDEKRDLDGGKKTYSIKPLHDRRQTQRLEAAAHTLMSEFAPFDYGRFECRLDVSTGQFLFLEINLNCNLWSRKTISLAARLIGWSHEQLIETILCESLSRQGLLRTAEQTATQRIEVAA